MTDKTNLMWVKCGPCGHVWIALYLPMEATKAALCMKRIYCPVCAETKKVFMAQPADIPAEAA